MKRLFFLSIIIFTVFSLQSCIQLKPFHVGDNVDIKTRISYMDNLEKTMNSVALSICKDNITNIAIGNFIDTLNNRVTKDGKYLAFDLKDKMWHLCKLNSTLASNAKWLKKSETRTIIKPQKGFDYFIYGTYAYTYRGYALFIKVINLKTRKTEALFAKKICNKKAVFDIDRLRIPKEVVIEPLW